MSKRVLLVLALVCALAVIVYGRQPQATRVQWEYTAYSGTDPKIINQRGAEGWELVTVQVTPPNSFLWVFKRPK